MEKILGMDIEQLTELSLEGERYPPNRSEEEELLNRAKAAAFVQSVLGRELLNSLKYHRCDSCDSMQLEVAELVVAKRKLNRLAINMLASRFNEGTFRAKIEFGLPAREFFVLWVNEFLERGPKILHGEMSAEDALGEGTMLDTWRRLEEFLG